MLNFIDAKCIQQNIDIDKNICATMECLNILGIIQLYVLNSMQKHVMLFNNNIIIIKTLHINLKNMNHTFFYSKNTLCIGSQAWFEGAAYMGCQTKKVICWFSLAFHSSISSPLTVSSSDFTGALTVNPTPLQRTASYS